MICRSGRKGDGFPKNEEKNWRRVEKEWSCSGVWVWKTPQNNEKPGSYQVPLRLWPWTEEQKGNENPESLAIGATWVSGPLPPPGCYHPYFPDGSCKNVESSFGTLTQVFWLKTMCSFSPSQQNCLSWGQFQKESFGRDRGAQIEVWLQWSGSSSVVLGALLWLKAVTSQCCSLSGADWRAGSHQY